jgi:hypothetical protein
MISSLILSRTLLFNMAGLMTVIVLCSWIGMMIFAFYYQCDPVEAGVRS